MDEYEILPGLNLDELSLEEIESGKIISKDNTFDVRMEKEILKKILIHYKKGENLYSFLKSLSDDDLHLMGNWPDTRNEKAFGKIIFLITMSLGLENPKKRINTLQIKEITPAFCVMCILALFEKNGLNKITDKSKWWVPDSELTIELTDKFCEMNGLLKEVKKK
ncbi:MAG TPA: hypothetical protein VHZ50_16310 [Puia sp.]|nr:hypothetical protein [Puia sp.]